MTERKWTPGEWLSSHVAVKTSDGALIARVYGNGTGSMEANAHLIAAAPEIYEALEVCLRFIENTEGEFDITLDSGDMARAALAKARGEAK